MNQSSSQQGMASVNEVFEKKTHSKRSHLFHFFKMKIGTSAGMIVIFCAAVSSMTLITAASAVEVWQFNDPFLLPNNRTVETNPLQSKVLGEAVSRANNKPACVNGECFYYEVSNSNIENFSPVDSLIAPDTDEPLISPAINADKKIVVSLNDQHLVYLEGTKIIGEFKISSGLKATPTPLGEYEILVKKPLVNYVGPGYNLPNTKWNLLFKPNPAGNYYIHGAYWHNNFGRPMSHGCINVSYENMEAIYNWADVGTKVIIQDEPVIPFADGALVLDTSDGKTTYVMDSGRKRGFTSPEVFKGLGYSFSQVIKSNLSGYPTGQPVSSVESHHPQGTLVKHGTAIYKITGNGKQLIPNENVFKSWDWTMNMVVEGNAADLALPNLDNIKYREGTLLQAADGIIYIVSNGKLNPISSTASYEGKLDTLMFVSQSDLVQ